MTPDALRSALARAGLPQPTAVDPIDHGVRLHFDAHPTMELVERPRSATSSARHARVGMELAEGALGVPGGRLPGDGATLLYEALPGEPPADPSRAGPALIAVLEALSTLEAPRFGHLSGAQGFWPLAPTWSESVAAVAALQAEAALSSGAPRAWVDRLTGWVGARAAALDRCPRFTLVHGALSPRVLKLGPEGPGVDGWERAHFGDPLEDLVRPILGPRDWFEPLRDWVRARVDPDGIARIEAYAAVRLLEQLQIGPSAGRAARRLDDTRRQLEALERGWIASCLSDRPPPPRGSPDALDLAIGTLALALPSLDPEAAMVAVGGLAAGVLARRARAAVDLELARALTRHVQAAASWADVASAPLVAIPGTGAEPDGTHGIAASWVLAQLSDGLPPGSDRRVHAAIPAWNALDASVRAQVAALPSREQHYHRLLRGVIALAAGAGVGIDEVRAHAEALDMTALALGGYDTDVQSAIELLAGLPALAPHQWLLFPFLLALEQVHAAHGTVMPPGVALRWLGVGT